MLASSKQTWWRPGVEGREAGNHSASEGLQAAARVPADCDQERRLPCRATPPVLPLPQVMLRQAGRSDVAVEIVFPVSPEAITTDRQAGAAQVWPPAAPAGASWSCCCLRLGLWLPFAAYRGLLPQPPGSAAASCCVLPLPSAAAAPGSCAAADHPPLSSSCCRPSPVQDFRAPACPPARHAAQRWMQLIAASPPPRRLLARWSCPPGCPWCPAPPAARAAPWRAAAPRALT